MNIQYKLIDYPAPQDRLRIFSPLSDFNLANGPELNHEIIAVSLADQLSLPVDGGLWGVLAYDWLYIEAISMPVNLRSKGVGRRLIEYAEGVAATKGAIGAWVDTFSWQAQKFYIKCGYIEFGKVENHPMRYSRIFLEKTFDKSSSLY